LVAGEFDRHTAGCADSSLIELELSGQGKEVLAQHRPHLGAVRARWLNNRRHLEETQARGSQLAVEGLVQEGLVQFLQGAEELIGHLVE
jgi:hypothetical protein